MKLLASFVCIIMLTGCKRDIVIETNPSEAVLMYNNEKFTTPVELQYPFSDDIHIYKTGYENEILTNKEAKKNDVVTIDLKLLPKYKLNIKTKQGIRRFSVFIDGEEVRNNMELYRGDYKLEVRAKGYKTFLKNIILDQDKEITIDLKKEYIIKNVPPFFTSLRYKEKIVKEGDKIVTTEEKLIFNYKIKDEDFLLVVDLNRYNNYKSDDISISQYIDLQPVILDKDSAKEIFTIEGSWIEPIQKPIKVYPEIFPVFGFGGEIYLSTYSEQDLLSEPPKVSLLGSIINPTDNLIGSYMEITVGKEKKTVHFGKDIKDRIIQFKDFYKDRYIESGYEDREELLKPSFIKGVYIDRTPPYTGLDYNIKLIKDGKTYREDNGTVKSHSFTTNNISIASGPKKSVFHSEREKDINNKRYIYSLKEYSGAYLVVYSGEPNNGDSIWTPVYLSKLSDIDDTPLVVSVHDKQKAKKLQFCITKDLTDVNVVSAKSLADFFDSF